MLAVVVVGLSELDVGAVVLSELEVGLVLVVPPDLMGLVEVVRLYANPSNLGASFQAARLGGALIVDWTGPK